MLTSIKLENFKCFSDELIPFSPLTILSGVNGMGKSTVLQSLLMLRQSHISGTIDSDGALLNGPLVSLGTADDVIYEHAEGDDAIGFELSFSDGTQLDYAFKYEKSKRTLENIRNATPDPSPLLSGDEFYYLKAERSGPRTCFPTADREMSRYNPIGNSGEYTPHLLVKNERLPLPSSRLCHQSQDLDELRLQVEAWLSEIGQSPRIHLVEHPKMDLVSMEFSFVRGGLPSIKYRATNVGFGLTYGLPVFVACLFCKPGGIVLVENPEAHLHPKGQMAMGKFLTKVASCGVQIVLETHSDHVLNGIRIAVRNGVMPCDDVSLHFFNRDIDAPHATRISPTMDRNGRLNQWPDGFFDEWEKGLAELL